MRRHPVSTQISLSGFNLGTVLLASIVLFPLACLFFGTRGGYYNTDYDGNGDPLIPHDLRSGTGHPLTTSAWHCAAGWSRPTSRPAKP